MRRGTPRTRGQGNAIGTSHPARLVAARSSVDVPSQLAARRGSEAGDARKVTCASSLRRPQARAKGRPAQGPAWLGRAKIAQRNAFHAVQTHKSFKLSKNSHRASTKTTPPTHARELPCGAWPASPGVLHIPLGAGYSVRFAHRVSAPAEESARAPGVHVTAHALQPVRSPPRKRRRRREQHLPCPSPNTRRPNGPGAATRPLGPAPGAEAAAFPGPCNQEKPTEASRIKKDEAKAMHPSALSLTHEAFVKTVKPTPAGFPQCAFHGFPCAPCRPRLCRAQPHPHGAPQPPGLHQPIK